MHNCSDERMFTELQAVIRLYLTLPVALFGIPANLANVIVFSNKSMRSQLVNWFLLALSVSDLCLLICHALFVALPVVADIVRDRWLLLTEIYVYFVIFAYPVGIMAQTASVYYTTLVCLDRYIGICHPLKAPQLATKRAVTIALIAAVMFNICRWMEVELQSCVAPHYGNREFKQIAITEFNSNDIYRVAYGTVGYTLVMFVTPFTVLIVTNSLMIRAIYRGKRVRQRMTSHTSATLLNEETPLQMLSRLQPTQQSPARNEQTPLIWQYDSSDMERRASECIPKRPLLCQVNFTPKRSLEPQPNGRKQSKPKRAEGRVTTMLLMIVAVFLLCNSLPFVNNILEILLAYSKWVRQFTEIHRVFDVSVELGNCLVAINSASTLLIYLMFSSKYRQIFASTFCCRKETLPTRSGVTTYGRASTAFASTVDDGRKSSNATSRHASTANLNPLLRSRTVQNRTQEITAV